VNFGLPAIEYIVIGIYLIIILGIGFYFSRFNTSGKDFFIGGNQIPWWVAGISLYMSLFSAWTFTGVASFVYNTGWFGIIFLTTWPLSFFVGFLLSAKKWRRSRITSPVEYLKTRFNKPTHLFIAIMLTLTSIYWPAHHLASLAKICAPTLFPNSMLAIDLMIIITGIVILFYSFTGGFWAVCVTDVIQFLVFISICLVLIPTIFFSGDLGSVGDFLNKIPALKFTHVIRGKTTYDFWYLLGVPVAYLFGYSVGGNAQRYYSVKDEKAASRVGWLAFGLFIFSPILFGIPPLIGKVLWPDVSMIEFFSQITKPDENIYIAVVIKYMPMGMVGIFLAAMMAASMSAMDSAWNNVAAIISLDIYKNFFNPKATEKQILQVGRLTAVVLCVIAIFLALTIIHSDYGIFTFTNIFFGLIAIPVPLALLIGLISKNISRWSAISSILGGTLVTTLARFALKYSLGQQYLITVAICLVFIYISLPLGKLYLRNRLAAFGANVALGVSLWTYFMTLNSNPALSFAALKNIQHLTWMNLLTSALFWVTISALGIIYLSHKFSARYAADLLADQLEVENFFQKLKTPIVVDEEILPEERKEINIFPLVGGIAMGLASLSLLILLVPGTHTNIGVNFAIGGLLFSIGGLMLLSKPARPNQVVDSQSSF